MFSPHAQQAPHTGLDRRRHAYRADLAAESLRGRVDVPAYVAGWRAQVVRPAAAVRREPSHEAGVETEALFGEIVTVYETVAGWSWVQLERDAYVGYLEASTLSDAVIAPTHRVSALGTYVYRHADIKSQPLMHLSLNACLTVTRTEERMAELGGGGWIARRHIAELDRHARDFVDVAERFIGTPYLWGGKTRLGIDCSGLVQVCLEAAGIAVPRDSDMQAAELGKPMPIRNDYEGLQRGDLVCWPGHIGIMGDGVMLLHANAHHMAVVAEPLPEAAARIARTDSRVTTIRRLPALGA